MKKKNQKLILMIVVVLLLYKTFIPLAIIPAELNVHVRDANNNPVSGAIVQFRWYIFGSNQGFYQGMTDDNGDLYKQVAVGYYVIIVVHPDFETYESEMTHYGEGSSEVYITLQRTDTPTEYSTMNFYLVGEEKTTIQRILGEDNKRIPNAGIDVGSEHLTTDITGKAVYYYNAYGLKTVRFKGQYQVGGLAYKSFDFTKSVNFMDVEETNCTVYVDSQSLSYSDPPPVNYDDDDGMIGWIGEKLGEYENYLLIGFFIIVLGWSGILPQIMRGVRR